VNGTLLKPTIVARIISLTWDLSERLTACGGQATSNLQVERLDQTAAANQRFTSGACTQPTSYNNPVSGLKTKYTDGSLSAPLIVSDFTHSPVFYGRCVEPLFPAPSHDPVRRCSGKPCGHYVVSQ